VKAFQLIALGLLPLLLLPGCRTRHDWAQKTTLTMETPQGQITASSVVEVTAWFGRLPATSTEVEYRVDGAPIVLELGPRQVLHVSQTGAAELFYKAAKDRFDGLHRRDWLKQIPKQTEPVELTEELRPELTVQGYIGDQYGKETLDPYDPDAVLGCDRYDPALLPWRATGQTYLDWRKDEVARLIPERIAERAGVSGIAAVHLQEVDRLSKGLSKRSDEEVWRYHWLRKRVDGEAAEAWRQAHNALLTELPPTIPTAADLLAEAGGPCYWITSMTLAITKGE